MIGKEKLKYLSSLKLKKKRKSESKFIVEGVRSVLEGLKSDYICEEIFIAEKQDSFLEIIDLAKVKNVKITEVTQTHLKKITDTVHPQKIAALFRITETNIQLSNIILALENISDPGNLGTIIRTADWLGVKNILLSKESVDIFNPKVLRSTMGSIFHINFKYVENFQDQLLKIKEEGYEIFLADLNGTNISEYKKPINKSVLILSNEAFGPTEKTKEIADVKLTIPKLGQAESLNVSIAGGILMWELRKRLHI